MTGPTGAPDRVAEAASSSPSSLSTSSPPPAATASAPQVTLPKGGGAIRGIGEKFAANPVTGTASMTIPIATSPGRSGFGPQLSLSYDSAAGNGPFGFGWNLSIPEITRKTDKGLPRYLDHDESDVFILSGAEDLVPVHRQDPDNAWVPGHSGHRRDPSGFWVRDRSGRLVVHEDEVDGYRVRRYRPRIEGLFARIERWTKIGAPGEVHWRSISKDNILTLYGFDADSRVIDPLDATHIFRWLISETRDDRGNVVLYRYKAEDGTHVGLDQAHERNRGSRSDVRRRANRYLKRIRYGNLRPMLDRSGQRPRFLDPTKVASAEWMFDVVFDYGDHDPVTPTPDDDRKTDPSTALRYPWKARRDPFSTYRSGFEIRTVRLCRRVLMFHHFEGEAGVGRECLVRSTDFTYSDDVDPAHVRNPIHTFLHKVELTGYRRRGVGYESRSLPPVEFEYTQPIVGDVVEQVEHSSLENLPVGLDGTSYQWADLHGEGIPGVLTEQGPTWYYKRNLSPLPRQLTDGRTHVTARFAPLETVAFAPNVTLRGGAELVDLAGDGQPDIVVRAGPTPGLYEHGDGEGWLPFRAFPSSLNDDVGDPNLRFVDLDGDGRADILITEDDALVWHESLGEAGFGPARRVARSLDEERGPRLVFADDTQGIYLADLSGDGLTDIARVRNGEVCYWPNLGQGHFGDKVSMDHAPWFDHPDQFEHRRVRLADIDGSGTTDLVYLHREGVHLYFNQSGNSWSAPQPLKAAPRIDDLVSVVLVDLLGNGTACLVWSSSLPADGGQPMQFVNLMGGGKPHLLSRTVNNLGAETVVDYAPSTKFYLQDRHDGRPWITRLPFPVHVVERVTTHDRVSRNRFVTRYAYHHGYFDGDEREFRGFGLVEQWDTEELGVLSQTEALGASTNIDDASHVPPVHIKTWFHTGAHLHGGRISRQYETEYHRGEAPGTATDQPLLADTVLPDTILAGGRRWPYTPSMEEEREAVRALKGSILRQETFANDASAEADRPYIVSERNYTIEVLQRQGDGRHAVFFAHARETLDLHDERKRYRVGGRDVPDPRVTHALTLEVDAFGNVTRSASVAYGRRHDDPDPVLTSEDRTRQRQTYVTCSENDHTDPIDDRDEHRAPLIADARTYELVNVPQPTTVSGTKSLVAFDAFVEPGGILERVADGSRDLPYQTRTGSGLRRRLIEHARSVYRRDDLSSALPLGQVESLALPFETYRLAFPGSLLDSVYRRRSTGGAVDDLITQTVTVMKSAGYVRGGELRASGVFPSADPVDDWWIPSGTVSYAKGSNELAEARRHFFLPRTYRDAFGSVTTVDYDAYDLLAQQTTDPVGNTVTAGRRTVDGRLLENGNDYRVLQPRLVTDPNRNRSEVVIDALGLVNATAVMGKLNQHLGDSVGNVTADLAETVVADHLRDPLRDPHSILQGATTRLVYDLFAYLRTRDDPQPQPVVVSSLSRETHESDLHPNQTSRVQHSFSYSDGFGREIQRKLQAEPGPGGSRRWVGSGWTIYNNKGKPVRRYEPFFTSAHRFELSKQVGVSSIVLYDPPGRVIATVHPDHSYEKVVFDPWRQQTWDGNDTVAELRPEYDDDVGTALARLPAGEYRPTWLGRMAASADPFDRAAADAARAHAATPTTAWVDALGRTFLTVAHNRFERNGVVVDEHHRTRVELDIEGNQCTVVDARDREVLHADFDMLGRRVRTVSMEAGTRWMLPDALGKPMLAWDSRGHTLETRYDRLRRPTDVRLQVGTTPAIVVQRTVYGEGRTDPEAGNLRGRVFRVLDAAGQLTTADYDFRGRSRRSRRQLAVEYRRALDWTVPANVPLGAESFETSTHFDALDRPIEVVTPDGTSLRPVYNEADLLERLDGNLRGATATTAFVKDIDYNAKGQRLRVVYGNSARCEYRYDAKTFRLVRASTTRGSDVLQDLRYTYDPVGNLTHIQDDALQRIFFKNQYADPNADYTYDATYRLVEATGREHLGQAARGGVWPPTPTPHPNVDGALGTYRERYTYDQVGNIVELYHASGVPTVSPWALRYAYDEPSLLEPTTERSNRLSSTRIGAGTAHPYTYDAHGNTTSMSHLTALKWDHRDRLQSTSRQRVGPGATPETTYYVYDATGERVRKVTAGQARPGVTATRKKERIYLGGFETYREFDSAGTVVTLERETLHVGGTDQRVALVETRAVGTDAGAAELTRYQVTNHLGSASLELDETGRIVTYEEHLPYGGTSYYAADRATETPKRYRYTGKERDEESGFSYHSARYYAPWLGRWTSCDPAGLLRHTNAYLFVAAAPTLQVDPNGFDERSFADLQSTVDEVNASGLKLGPKPSGGSLDVLVPDPDPRVETPPAEPREKGNAGAGRSRRASNSTKKNPPVKTSTGASLQVGKPRPGDEMSHMYAVRNVGKTGIPNDIVNAPENIPAAPGVGKNALLQNQDGTVRTTDVHAATEPKLDEIAARNLAGKTNMTQESSAAAQRALAESKRTLEPMTRAYSDKIVAGGTAAAEPGPPVDPKTGAVVSQEPGPPASSPAKNTAPSPTIAPKLQTTLFSLSIITTVFQYFEFQAAWDGIREGGWGSFGGNLYSSQESMLEAASSLPPGSSIKVVENGRTVGRIQVSAYGAFPDLI